MEFVYWPIKGLAEHIRYLLNYLKIEYKETTIEDYDQWIAEKNNIGLPFPNLPYIVDGDFKLSESRAIARYLCDKFGPQLSGNTPAEKALIENISGFLEDITKSYASNIADKEGIKEKMEALVEKSNSVEKVKQLAVFLGNKEYFHGHITVNDFEFAAVAYRIWAYTRTHDVTNPIMDHPNLHKLTQRIRRLPGVKEYLETPHGKFVQNSMEYLAVPLIEGDFPMD